MNLKEFIIEANRPKKEKDGEGFIKGEEYKIKLDNGKVVTGKFSRVTKSGKLYFSYEDDSHDTKTVSIDKKQVLS